MGSNPDPTPTGLTLEVLGRYQNTGVNEMTGVTAAEIPAYDPASRRLFVVNATVGDVDVLNLSNPASPTLVGKINISALGGSANGVAVARGVVAVAVEATVKTNPGVVAFYRASDLSLIQTVAVGALPDMVTFTPDGTRLLVANEGEPNRLWPADSVDPEGSVSIVTLTRQRSLHRGHCRLPRFQRASRCVACPRRSHLRPWRQRCAGL